MDSDTPDRGEEQVAGSNRPNNKDSDEEGEEDSPLARSDRYTTGTVSREKWIEMMNQADSFDQSLQAKKEYGQTEPPVRSIKAYQQDTRYYLLNRGETPLERLRYRAYEVDVNLRRVEETQLYEVRDVPPESYFQVGEMDLEAQRRMAFTLVSAQWEDGHVFEAESREGRRLRMFDPADPVPSPERLGLSVTPAEPTPIES